MNPRNRPRIRWLALPLILATAAPAAAQSGGQTGFGGLPGPFIPPPTANLPPNTVLPPFPHDAKTQWAQAFMLFNPLSVRDLLNVMVHKRQANPGVSFNRTVEALVARALKHGFLLVNRYPLSTELQRQTGEANPYRMEVISICDPSISREWLDFAPEMAPFVPPRISVLEDANRNVWIMMLDWDMRWIATARNAAFSERLYRQGLERREMLEDIMRAAAEGEIE